MKPVEERRAYQRYQVDDCAFSVESKFGQVLDISMGGLSFCYVAKGDGPETSFELGTLFGDDDLCLDKLPVKAVSSQTAAKAMEQSSARIVRCGLQFGELTSVQRLMLDYFIQAVTAQEM